MIRHRHPVRPEWRTRLEEIGFEFHSTDDVPYWDETGAWEFTGGEIDALDDAAVEVHHLALQAVDAIVQGGQLSRLGITGRAATLVERSWARAEEPLYGRFDVAWNGSGPPKFLEYNADTPTTLYEASVVQWHWLEELHPEADQFNSLHEALVQRWQEFSLSWPDQDGLHLACMVPHAEDQGTIEYLQATAQEAGLAARVLGICDIGWNGQAFVDLDRRPIRRLFKLYPWEWLATEPFAAHIVNSVTSFIEPAWKLVLANKGLFAIMWEMFPDHPNLLATAFEPSGLKTTPTGRLVSKPLLGREGSNVSIFEEDTIVDQTGGPYAHQPVVWQEWAPLAAAGPTADGAETNAVFGLWMIGDRCRGLGVREDRGMITRNSSRFVPHFFR